MKLFQATALIPVFLVDNALSFAEISTAPKCSPLEPQDIPQPDLYLDSKAHLKAPLSVLVTLKLE
jgi:hypothetical protein